MQLKSLRKIWNFFFSELFSVFFYLCQSVGGRIGPPRVYGPSCFVGGCRSVEAWRSRGAGWQKGGLPAHSPAWPPLPFRCASPGCACSECPRCSTLCCVVYFFFSLTVNKRCDRKKQTNKQTNKHSLVKLLQHAPRSAQTYKKTHQADISRVQSSQFPWASQGPILETGFSCECAGF